MNLSFWIVRGDEESEMWAGFCPAVEVSVEAALPCGFARTVRRMQQDKQDFIPQTIEDILGCSFHFDSLSVSSTHTLTISSLDIARPLINWSLKT